MLCGEMFITPHAQSHYLSSHTISPTHIHTGDHNNIAGCTLSLPLSLTVTLPFSHLRLPSLNFRLFFRIKHSRAVRFFKRAPWRMHQHWGFSLFALLCLSVFERFSLLIRGGDFFNLSAGIYVEQGTFFDH